MGGLGTVIRVSPTKPPVDLRAPLRDLPDSGYVYSTAWKLLTSDIDSHLNARLDGVARYIQEVGAEHLADAGAAEAHPHWIVQRTVIDVITPIGLPSDITFRRWCSALSPRWCTMRVRLDGSDGGRIETEGFWILMNKDTLTPSRVSDEVFDLFASTTDVHRLQWRPWLPGAVPDDAQTTPFPLRYTDIDLFEHVTNAAYWHGVHEVLASEPDLATTPYRAVVEYRKPIKLDETVVIAHERRGDALHMWFLASGVVKAAALVCRL